MIETASGLILRTRPLTDTSLIVQWLTPEFGRFTTVAKGARRPKSPFSGKLDLFYEADFSFVRSRRSELHTLREVNLRETNPTLRHDLEKLRRAADCAALIEHSVEMESPVPQMHALLVGFLKQLSRPDPAPHARSAFELKLLSELGLQPDFENEKLPADLKNIMRTMLAGDWKILPRLKLSAPQSRSLDRYLQEFMAYHLGKAPKGRKRQTS